MIKTMINTRTGKVVVFDKYLMLEMPWYEIIPEKISEESTLNFHVNPPEISENCEQLTVKNKLLKKPHWKTALKLRNNLLENQA